MKFKDAGLPVEERADDLLERLSLNEKINFLHAKIEPVERLGIPGIHINNEALHGVIRPGKATVFPQAIALAATWDTELIHEVGMAISDECRAKQNTVSEDDLYRFGSGLVMFSPVVNMARDPRWGRTQETYGEDPYLTSKIGEAFITGMQGNDEKYLKVACCPKHFAANNEEHNRFECNAEISEDTLHDYYLKAFKHCFAEARAAVAMAAYNAINSIPCHASRKLLTEILRDAWGFDGFVISDAGGVTFLHSKHEYVKTPLEAAAAAIKAGLDLELGRAKEFPNHLEEAINAGLIDESLVDQAAKRVLKVLFKLGWFDPAEMVPYSTIGEAVVGSKKHQQLALETARKSLVLLKNSPVNGAKTLPLDPVNVKKLAVVGNNADRCVYGHYSGVAVNSPVSPLEGIFNRAPEICEVNLVKWKYQEPGQFDIAAGETLKAPDSGEDGFQAEYFDNPALSGPPSHSRTDEKIDFFWQWLMDPVANQEQFSARWTTVFTPEISGTHTFRIAAASGCRFSVGGTVEHDSFGDKAVVKKDIACELEAGCSYTIVLEVAFYDYQRRMAMLRWNLPENVKANNFEYEAEAAADADAVIAVIGLDTDIESEGRDRFELELPYPQVELIKKLAQVNHNLIVVVENGSSLAIPEIVDIAPALIEAWYPGEQGGNAIADVIFGNVNPSGKLPLTFFRSTSELPDFNDYEVKNNRTYMYYRGKPLFPFGYGLSYTEFRCSEPVVRETSGGYEITAEITNCGEFDGEEVVQLYYGVKGQSGKFLCGFQRIFVPAGKTERIVFSAAPETPDMDNIQFYVE